MLGFKVVEWKGLGRPCEDCKTYIAHVRFKKRFLCRYCAWLHGDARQGIKLDWDGKAWVSSGEGGKAP